MPTVSCRRFLLAAFALTVAGCAQKLEGPAPALSAASPQAVCGEQLTTAVTVTGSGLSPLFSDGLTEQPRLNLPQLQIVHAKDLGGAAGSGKTIQIPDDAADPTKSRVKWTSQESMTFEVFPELKAEPGLYTIHVDNKNGKSTDFSESFLVVPRPTISSIRADVVCSDKSNTVTIDGDFFIKAGAALPKVSFGALGLLPASAEQCRPLPGSAGLEACKRLTVALATKALQPGNHPVVVTNPPTVSCASTEAVILTLVPEPVLTKIQPDLVCTVEGTNSLTATGTGFITIDGTAPLLALGALELPTTASNCTKVMGPSEDVQSCTTLSATLAKDGLPPASYDVKVKNPVPVDCDSAQPIKFTVVPAPTVTSAEPDLICVAELDRTFTVKGTGFLTVDGAAPTLQLAALTLTTTATDCVPVVGPTQTVTTCTTLTATVPKGTAPASLQVVVKNPAPAGCSSTQPVYLFVVPPPAITSIVPELACSAQSSTSLVINGTGFLTVNGAAPSVKVGSLAPAATASGCTPFPAPSPTETVQVCTSLTVTIPQATAAGALAIQVTNPAPAGCSSTEAVSFTIVAPPTLASLVPDLFCSAQGGNTLTASGTGFLRIGTESPTLVIGTSSFPTTLSNCAMVPGPATSMVESCTTATATVGQAAVAEGVHSAKIVNPQPAGCESKEAVAVVVVPAPAISSLAPDLTCAAEGAISMTLTGTGFVKIGAALPSVSLGSATLAPSGATGCVAIPGTTTGAEACTGLALSIPQGTAAGELSVSVTNPPPTGCSSASAKLFLAPPPTLSAIVPPGICAGGVAPVTVQLDGTDFLRVAGATAPTVTIGTVSYASTVVAASCAAVSGYSQAIDRCTSITVSVNPSDFPANGTFAAVVRNPAPAACSSTQTVSFNVTAKPTLTGATPTKICAQGGSIDLTGTNFVPGMVVRLLTSPAHTATTVTVTGTTAARATFVGPVPVGGPFDVEIVTAAGGCDARLNAVSVVTGPVVFFVDPSVVYNGITTQGTVYASGFVAAGLAVNIRPTGGTALTPVPAAFNPLKANRIQITLASGLTPGSYDVLISDSISAACPGELISAFTVVNQTTLSLTAITPPFGFSGGETAVEITANPTAGGGLKALPRVYLNPTGAGVAVVLESVTLTDSGRMTAVVPAGAQVGTYDLIVVNPDGGVGLLAAAFKVVIDPVPLIDTVVPGSLLTGQAAAAFRVTGSNFRSPALEFRCQDATTGAITTLPATVTASTASTVDATVNSSAISNGQACVLRATNTDGTYADFSAVVFTNPAQKLTTFKPGPALSVARRALVAQAGFVTRAAQFLYAIGGDTGSAASTLDTVESVPLDLFGNPGSYSTQRNKLVTARAFATGQRVGRFLYVAGGRSDATSVLGTIERAYLLNPSDRVDVTDFDLNVSSTEGIAGGVYYYRVSATMGAADLFNPNGENLPSDPIPLALPSLSGTSKISVTLRWTAVSGAASYQVYRTLANAPAGTEKLVGTVAAPAVSFTDTGAVAPAGQSPLAIGSVGRWSVAATLATAREGAASALAVDPADPTRFYLYVLGGRGSTGSVLATHEALSITLNPNGSQTVGTPATGAATLGAARWQLGSYAANAQSAPRVGTSQYIYAVAGLSSTGLATGRTEAALVGAGGVLGAFATTNVVGMTPARAGFGHAVANDYLFAFGGLGGNPDTSTSAAQISTSPPAVTNWQSTSAPMSVARYVMGSTLHGAFIYVVGGEGSAGATASTEQIIW